MPQRCSRCFERATEAPRDGDPGGRVGLNDAPIVVLVVAISAGDLAEKGAWAFTGLIVFELVVGAMFGFVIGRVGASLLRRVALPASGLYPLVVFAFTVLAYASAATIHASGFAAVYIAALVLGNTELPHRTATKSFVEGIGWLAQIGLFVMLGLLADPESFRVVARMDRIGCGRTHHLHCSSAVDRCLRFGVRPAVA